MTPATAAAPGHVVSSPIEHPAVAEPVARLEAAGFAVDRPAVDAAGVADAERMAAAFRPETRLATLMLANNETGALQPVARLAALAGAARASRSTPTPCRPSAGSRSISTRWAWPRWPPARTSSTARWGSGCSWSASGVRLRSRLFGGGQQQGRRPGTVAVPLAVGLAAALERWQAEAHGPDRPLDGAARPAGGGPDRRARARPGRPQRPVRPRAAAPPDAQPRLPRPRRRRPADAARPGRHRRLARLGLRQRLDPALAHPGRHARPRRPPPLLGPLQPRRHDDRGRDRRRRRPDHRHRCAAFPGR